MEMPHVYVKCGGFYNEVARNPLPFGDGSFEVVDPVYYGVRRSNV